MDGDLLTGATTPLTQVIVKAANEDLLLVTAKSVLELTKAAYHLGNRHVDLELNSKELLFLEDPVLAEMLMSRGLSVKQIRKPFFPEMGAYSNIAIHNH